MKTPVPLLLSALLLLPGLARAQTSQVPNRLSYQGVVTDIAGTPLGNTTPANHEVIFRLWDSPTAAGAGNLIYSEKQTVTISNGEFSVLIGAGANVSGDEAKGPGTVNLSEAFSGDQRFLGVTVAALAAPNVIVGSDLEITPRQQLVSTAFSFRAKQAETLGTSAGTALTVLDSGNVGVGNSSPPARFTITGANTSTSTSTPQLVVTADDVTERLRIGVDSTGNGTSFLQSWKEGTGLGTGATNLLLNPNGGNVGIGTMNPFAQFQVGEGFGWASPRFQAYGGFQQIGADLTLGSFVFHAGAQNQASLSFKAVNNGTQGWTGTSVGITYEVDGVASPVGGDIWMWNGKVGIGKKTPGYKLDVNGSLASTSLITTGSVGIGTDSPWQAKLVVEGVGGVEGIGQHWFAAPNYTGTTGVDYFAYGGVSIRASGVIQALSYRAVSDERIKVIEGVSDRAKDLELLSKIEITDYTHKDVIERGNVKQKKVIAQQLEKVFPQAVEKITDVVPDIYKVAKTADGWVELETDLKVGERVRLIGEKEKGIYEVLEVKNQKFRTEFKPETDQVFVYGREVKDFRVVDYEAVAMLNVSATQELAKRVDALTQENESLKTKLAASEKLLSKLAASEKLLSEFKAGEKARDERLAAIEKRLSADKSSVIPVSLKTAAE